MWVGIKGISMYRMLSWQKKSHDPSIFLRLTVWCYLMQSNFWILLQAVFSGLLTPSSDSGINTDFCRYTSKTLCSSFIVTFICKIFTFKSNRHYCDFTEAHSTNKHTVYLVHMHHARFKALTIITVLCTESQLVDMIWEASLCCFSLIWMWSLMDYPNQL